MGSVYIDSARRRFMSIDRRRIVILSTGSCISLARSRIDATTLAGKLQMHILGAIAEFERARIQERVRAGLARARAQGVRLGRPDATSTQSGSRRLQACPSGRRLGDLGFRGPRSSGFAPARSFLVALHWMPRGIVTTRWGIEISRVLNCTGSVQFPVRGGTKGGAVGTIIPKRSP